MNAPLHQPPPSGRKLFTFFAKSEHGAGFSGIARADTPGGAEIRARIQHAIPESTRVVVDAVPAWEPKRETEVAP